MGAPASPEVKAICPMAPAPAWGKGDSHLLCEAPGGPFRQKVAVTFSGLARGPRTVRRKANNGRGLSIPSFRRPVHSRGCAPAVFRKGGQAGTARLAWM